MPISGNSSSPTLTAIANDRPTVGEYVPASREWAGAVFTLSGAVLLTFWTADKSETINNLRVATAATAAAATPTLCRMGIYSVNDAGDLTALVASTANDTTLFATANTAYTRATTSPFNKVAGNRYATAVLVVTAVATPTFVGTTNANGWYAHMFELPAAAGRVASQTDLAASYTRAQQIQYPHRVGFTLT